MRTLLCFMAALICSMPMLQAQQKMKLVKDINPGYFDPSNPAIVGGLSNGKVLLFAGNNPSITYGSELWISDGTLQGTTIVKEIAPGTNNSVFAYTAHVINDKLYFLANDGTGKRVYVSDGTDTGTYVLMDTANKYKKVYADFPVVEYNGKVYFAAEDSVHGYELWCSDGTQAGTRMFMDIMPGTRGSGPCYLSVAFGKLIFAANDSVHGLEMWTSDGTVPGTKMIADITPGKEHGLNGSYSFRGYYKNALYFQARSSVAMGYELYATDGNTMWLVKDFDSRVNIGGDPSYFAIVGNKLFFSAQDSAHGRELWMTDGTTAGTQMVKDIEPGVNGSVYTIYGDLNGKVIFEANTKAYGQELWTSDGTANGTAIIVDMNTGSDHGKITTRAEQNTALGFNQCNFMHDGKFYFAGNGNTGGWIELWVTDGTAAGTKAIASDQPEPPVPGIHLEEVNWLNILHDKVWVSYKPGANDFELYSYDIYDTPAHVKDYETKARTIAVYPNPGNGSFEIRLDNNTYAHGQLKVIDMLGKVVYSQSINRGTRHLPVTLNNVSAGVYNVTVQLDGELISRKITLE